MFGKKVLFALLYIYRYGVHALCTRFRDKTFLPQKMGMFFLLRNGCREMGHVRILHTAMEGKCHRLIRESSSVRIYLTVPAFWGGGAVYWLNEHIKAHQKGELSLVVSPTNYDALLFVRVWDGADFKMSFWIEHLSILGSLPKGGVKELVISTIVAWRCYVGLHEMDDNGIEDLMNQIVSLKNVLNCKLTYLAHDYYSICPRLFLATDNGDYCGRENDIENCKTCLKDGVKDIDIIKPNLDIQHWRDVMVRFFGKVDEIRTFCDDSKLRLKSVFPDLKYTVVPHNDPKAIKRKPELLFDKIHIGIIGNITRYKGQHLVDVLASFLQERHPDIELTIIGHINLNSKTRPSNIKVTGKYKQEELPYLVEETGVNIIFFPSTVPETFSYVMHEIMQMELPVVTLDRGAQKDCAVDYKWGTVAPDTTPESIWQSLSSLYEQVKLERGK